jgi:hypothetical protein
MDGKTIPEKRRHTDKIRLPRDLIRELRMRAEEQRMPLGKYLADLVKNSEIREKPL